MTSQSTAAADDALDDPRVVEALDEYVAAAEMGRKLDRVAFLAAHADIAGPLAKCLDGLAFVQSAAPQLAPPVDAVDLDNATPLGDFRLIRVIGRGGMGTVYEAEQLSLGRRVALKVLPFAAALDPKQLQRFKNEAQAAAHLQHAHIVPVYGVGCERGVHYYAMQLIEGRSLAEVIRAWREQNGLEATTTAIGDPTPARSSRTTDSSATDSHHYRRLARLVRQAAEGLEHAHQCGVIHRDVKPANLLVDAADQLWITDFGLAQFHDHLGVTMTGDVLGTLRYMSPEQAAARREMIDHRTDVYSLGATLYELLTLEPAVAGTDRQALVRQITDTEPVPPSRLKPNLPVDLETIVLKALGKAPAERYRTAQEMADDLQRFLDDRPVLARRPTLWQRCSKAVRRHRTLFTTVVLSLVIMLALAVVILAVSASRIADRETKIQSNYLEAKKQHERAEENFKKTLAVVDRFLVRVGDTKLASNAHTVDLRRDLLLDALRYFEEFLAEREDDPSLRFEIAAAHRRLGNVQSHLGQPALAKEAYQRGLEICEMLVAKSPDNLEYRNELAHCCYWRSQYAEAGQTHEKLLRRAIELWQDRSAAAPTSLERHKWLAFADHQLAYHLANDDRVAEGERHYKTAAQATEQWLKAAPTSVDAHEHMARIWTSYGLLLRQSERLDEAENALKFALNSLTLASRLIPNRDQEPTHRTGMSRVLGHLSHVLWRRHRREEALRTSEEAIALWRSLAAATPAQFERTELALTLHQQATWLAILRRPQQAEEAFREAIREITIAAQDPGEVVAGRLPRGDMASINLAMIRASLGQFLHFEGRLDEAAEVFDVALRAYQQMQARLPEDPDLSARIAWLRLTCPIDRYRDHAGALKLAQHAVQRAPRGASHWGTLGLAQYRAGDYQAAVVSLEKAASLRTSGGGTSGFILAMAHFRLGNPAAAREEFTRTAAWMDQGCHEHADLRHFRAEAEKLLAIK